MTSDMSLDAGASDVAIVGISARVPGADSVEELWAALRAGQELITFFSRDELLSAGVTPAEAGNSAYVAARGVLARPYEFDADFFGYSAREAELTDPQQRLLLEEAWHAAEDAGYVLSRLGGRVGVFCAVAPPTYLPWFGTPDADPFELQLGNDPDFAAARIGYKLGLEGITLTVASGCSSGLAAVHLAAQSLLSGETDACLAGAASVRFPVDRGRLREPGSILSADGHCRPFSASADGTVEADGVACLLLRRLSDALSSGDHVYAVIRGSATGSDGARRVGFTAPGTAGQVATIRSALRFAGVNPAEVGYVEAHGTGTRLGDPIELSALAAVYGASARTTPCRIGSIKSNLGHLNHVSGIAGLIKTALCLQHRELVASLHIDRVNPDIDLADGRLALQATRQEWLADGASKRLAAVSSFGMGGTNVHMVLGEAPPRAPLQPSPGPRPIVLSARSEAALARQRANLADWLDEHPDVPLAEVADTLQTGRSAFAYRTAVGAETPRAAAAALRRTAAGDGTRPASGEGGRRLVCVFPGQGSQRQGMARALYGLRDAVVFQREIDASADIAAAELGIDIRSALLANQAGDGLPVDHTLVAQPALFAYEYAQAMQWRAWGVVPDAMIGHSVGEYAAACLAGVFSRDDALRLLCRRAELVASTESGAMLAITATEETLLARLDDWPGSELSAHNAPDQWVISLPSGRLAEVRSQLRAARIPAVQLNVSHSFHSRTVEPIMQAFAALVASTPRAAPAPGLISTVTGTWATQQEIASVGYWTRQLREPVRFAEALHTAQSLDPVYLYVGPGRPISGLARQGTVSGNLENGAGVADVQAALWTAGVNISWSAGNSPSRRLALPTYPFERRSYRLSPADTTRSSPSPRPAASKTSVDDWFYVPTSADLPHLPPRKAALPATLPQRWLVIGTDGLARTCADLLRASGREVTARSADEGGPHAPGHEVILYFCARPQDENDLTPLWRLVKLSTELTAGQHHGATLVVVTKREASPGHVADAAVSGLWRVLAQENPSLRVRHLDLGRETSALAMLSALASTDEADLLIRGDQWLAPRVVPLPVPSSRLPDSVLVDGGTYVITGAFGPVGLRLAGYLAKRCRARLVLIGRREIPPRQDWEAWATVPGSAAGKLTAAMLRMERDGAVVIPMRADVSSLDQLRDACQAGLADLTRLTGIVHAAGVADRDTFPLIRDTHVRDVEGHFLAKLSGTRNVAAVARAFRPDFVLAISSLATLLGGLGFGAYAAANACLESIARDASTSETPWTVLNLDGWERDDGAGSPFRAGASQLIADADADVLFDRVFRLCGLPTVLVSTTDLPERSDRAAVAPAAPTTTTGGASAPYPRPELPTAYRAPDDELEACVAEICADLLRVDRVGVDDDFFLLGGHSLLAMQLLARLNAEFGIDLPLRSAFDSPTAAGLAKAMEAAYLRGEVGE